MFSVLHVRSCRHGGTLLAGGQRQLARDSYVQVTGTLKCAQPTCEALFPIACRLDPQPCSRFGWQSVFYLFALLGLLWCAAWPLFKPEQQDSGEAAVQ